VKILYLVNIDWFFVSHRLPIALAAKDAGYEVFVAAKETDSKEIITKHGLKFVPINLERTSTNLFQEFFSLIRIIILVIKIKPDIIHNITIKPIIYGTIAARLTGVKRIINAVSGLGYNFTNNNLSPFKIKIFFNVLKRIHNSKKVSVIFQNPSDKDTYINNGIINNNQYILIKGSGVDLKEFSFTPALKTNKVKFLFSARLLIDKGINEFISAAKIISKSHSNLCEFIVAGKIDSDSPIMVKEEVLKEAHNKGFINFIGFSSNIKELLRGVDVVVLPSYYGEGVPKALIEASAIGRPIITTDMPGCKETVVDGRNGFLIPPKDVPALCDKIGILIQNPELRMEMGHESRLIAEDNFSIEHVINETLNIYT